jgi:hypothetical protein
MRLILHELLSMHPGLRGHPTDYARLGGLALQRSGHEPPVRTEIDHDGSPSVANVEWSTQDLALLKVMDANRITEDGAEALALTYANTSGGWVIERRMRRGEHADWLLRKPGRSLAVEISGTVDGDEHVRLRQKKTQVARCSLPVERLAIVVAFDRPLILAGQP